MSRYDKKPLSINEQIALLQKRGMEINNVPLAHKYLGHISYYRLAGYWWSMQSDHKLHQFRNGSTFTDVIAIYNFDAKLRLLLFDIIEKIEISLLLPINKPSQTWI